MERNLSTVEKLSNGWWNFEYLDPEAEKFTELLERYKLQVQHSSSSVWVATLLPYDSEHSVVPEFRTPGPIRSWLLKLLPSRIRTRILADYILREGLREYIECVSLQREIEDGNIDGYYCAVTSHHVQDCLEGLLRNVKCGERYTHPNPYEVPAEDMSISGWPIPYHDTMSQYLMRGKLNGSIGERQVVLRATHPTLPEFSIHDPSFLGAYNKLVGNMKVNASP